MGDGGGDLPRNATSRPCTKVTFLIRLSDIADNFVHPILWECFSNDHPMGRGWPNGRRWPNRHIGVATCLSANVG
jgi:hypothetical protein